MFWERTFKGMWLIFFFGYFHFYVAIILVLKIKEKKNRVIAVGSIYGVAIVMNIIRGGFFGWVY